MKKVLIYSLAVVVILNLCSCSKQLNDASKPDSGNAISFANPATKADLGDIQDGGFSVWAIINNSTYENYPLMDNRHVEYNDGKWVYSPLGYWMSNTVFNFVATYPYSADGTYYKLASDNSAVILTVDETPSEVDFLMATKMIDTSDNSFDGTQAVNLDFQHMLTSVVLQIWIDGGKHQNDQMRITNVTLGNIRKSGTYSSSSATKKWTPGNERVTIEYVNENLSDTDNIGAVIINDNGSVATKAIPAIPFGTIMLIPQTLDPNMVSLKIQYQLKRQNAADWEEAELETFLPAATWESNRRYTYNVVLSSVTDITIYYIQTKVDPWGTPQVGGTVVIK